MRTVATLKRWGSFQRILRRNTGNVAIESQLETAHRLKVKGLMWNDSSSEWFQPGVNLGTSHLSGEDPNKFRIFWNLEVSSQRGALLGAWPRAQPSATRCVVIWTANDKLSLTYKKTLPKSRCKFNKSKARFSSWYKVRLGHWEPCASHEIECTLCTLVYSTVYQPNSEHTLAVTNGDPLSPCQSTERVRLFWEYGNKL